MDCILAHPWCDTGTSNSYRILSSDFRHHSLERRDARREERPPSVKLRDDARTQTKDQGRKSVIVAETVGLGFRPML